MIPCSSIPRYAVCRLLGGTRTRVRLVGQQSTLCVARRYSNAVGVEALGEREDVIFKKEGTSTEKPLKDETSVQEACGAAEVVLSRSNPSPLSLLKFLENPIDNEQVNIGAFIGLYRHRKDGRSNFVLTAEQSSSLIRFLGTLSLFSSRQDALNSGLSYGAESIFGFDGRALFVDEKLFGKHYWAFVLELARDKGSQGDRLTKEDNYWLMVAALEDAKRDSSGRSDHVKRARNYYLLSHRSQPDWMLHFHYFESLHALDAQTHADELVLRSGNLLLWHNFLPWRLVQLLRNVLLTHPERVSSKARSRTIHAIQTKIRRRMPVRGPTNNPSLPPSSSTFFDSSYDASSIRDLLADVTFAAQSKCGNTSLFADVLEWVVWETRAAMDSCTSHPTKDAVVDVVAWNNLCLLAMSYGFPNIKDYRESDLDIGQSLSIGWTVICSLSAVEKSVLAPSTPRTYPPSLTANSGPSEGLHDTVRTLWMLWRNYVDSSRAGAHLSATVICCVLVTFLRLATFLRDLPLKNALTRHIADALVYPALYNDQSTLTEGALLAVAVEYAVSCTIIHNLHSLDDILDLVQEAQLYPAKVGTSVWRATVVNGVLTQLLRHDALLAYGLYKAVDENSSIVFRSETICSLGEALASAGFLELACVCLRDKRLEDSARGRVLEHLLLHVIHFRQHTKLEAQTIRSLAQALAYASEHLPTKITTTRTLEHCLLMILNAGHFEEASEAVSRLQATNPEMLRPAFVNTFFSRLLASRRHRLLEDVIAKNQEVKPNPLLPNHPNFNYLRRLVGLGGTHTQPNSRSVAFSIHEWPTLRRFLRFNPHLAQQDNKILSLKLSSAFSKKEKIETEPSSIVDERTLERVVFTLIRAGRVRAAMKYADVALAPTSPSSAATSTPKPVPTKVGNIILAGSLLPRRGRRNSRQLRHATQRLAFLVEQRGFVPDRVTLNLVLKALLRWPKLAGASELRVLFDRLVSSGYPGVSGLGQGEGVFGTEEEDGQSMSSVLGLGGLQEGVSFAKHLRPLYRMFAKAFRARGDREAAVKVQDILRAARARADIERVRREWYRREGRKRKRISENLSK